MKDSTVRLKTIENRMANRRQWMEYELQCEETDLYHEAYLEKSLKELCHSWSRRRTHGTSHYTLQEITPTRKASSPSYTSTGRLCHWVVVSYSHAEAVWRIQSSYEGRGFKLFHTYNQAIKYIKQLQMKNLLGVKPAE